MKSKAKLRIDFYVVLGIVLVSIPLIMYVKAPFYLSTFLFFIVPSIYLLIRKPRAIHKTLAASFIFGSIVGFGLDLWAVHNKTWLGPTEQLLFKYKFFGLVPIDEFLWWFFWVFSIIVFYEHFFEHERTDRVSPKFKWMLSVGLVILFLVMSILGSSPSVLAIPYAYLIIALIGFGPSFYLITRELDLLPKFIKTAAFFFVVYLSFEITALKIGQWYFPGQYIGQVIILGEVIPIEEFFFWIMMSSMAVLTYYEFFIDDLR